MISDIREEPEKDLIKNDHIQDGRGVNNCQFEIRVFYRRVDIQTANFTCLTKSYYSSARKLWPLSGREVVK